MGRVRAIAALRRFRGGLLPGSIAPATSFATSTLVGLPGHFFLSHNSK